MGLIIKGSGSGKLITKGDKDAKDYIRRVEIAHGQFLESSTRNAIIDFVVGCKNDGTWDAITSSCILAGARTLAGALIPLKGVAPTNYNFISSDYNRVTGLKGNGSNKFLNSGLNSNSFPGSRRENQHLTVNISEFTGGSNIETFIGYDRGSTIESGVTYKGDTASIAYTLVSSENSQSNLIVGKDLKVSGFTGVTRNTLSSFNLFFAPPYFSQTLIRDAAPATSSNRNICVFARGHAVLSLTNQYTTARINFYSIGTNINSLQEQFQARVLTLLSSLSTLT